MHENVNVLVAQSCLTLCDSMGYTVHGILQARILEWGAFPSSRGSSQTRDHTQASSRGSSRPRDHTQVSRIAGKFSPS